MSVGPGMGGNCLVSLLDLWPKTPSRCVLGRFFCLNHRRASTPGAPCLEQCSVFWWGHIVVLQGSTFVQGSAHTRPELLHQSLSAPCPSQEWSQNWGCTQWTSWSSCWAHERALAEGQETSPPVLLATSWWGRCTCSSEACWKSSRIWMSSSFLISLCSCRTFMVSFLKWLFYLGFLFFCEERVIFVSGFTGENPEWNYCLAWTTFEDGHEDPDLLSIFWWQN